MKPMNKLQFKIKLKISYYSANFKNKITSKIILLSGISRRVVFKQMLPVMTHRNQQNQRGLNLNRGCAVKFGFQIRIQ
jgi:hypothetical protein